MSTAAAWIYAALALIVSLFQFSLAAGAPWGHLTVGGQFPGVLPGAMRVAAVAQGLLLVAMAVVVLTRAGALRLAVPGWAFWVAVAVTVMTTVLNLATPSVPERMLWGPVTVIMLICVLIVAFGAKAARAGR